MESITKASIDRSQIEKIFEDFCGSANIRNYVELTDGCFNTSYLISLEDGDEFVLKVAPPDQVTLLTYEQNLIRSELAFYDLLADNTSVPLPEIVKKDLSKRIIPHGYFIMRKFQGRPLDKIGPLDHNKRKHLYKELAAHMAQIHTIKGTYFGYPFMDSDKERSYFESYCHMIDMVLFDGASKNVSFPVSADELYKLIKCFSSAFECVEIPVLVHYDLWDGNIFVRNNGQNLEIEGIIDLERGFFGDPAADFSQVDGYINLEENLWFFDEYNKYAAKPFAPDKSSFARIKLYRLYLLLIMIVESYFRDVNGSYQDQLKWSENEFLKQFDSLKKQAPDFSEAF